MRPPATARYTVGGVSLENSAYVNPNSGFTEISGKCSSVPRRMPKPAPVVTLLIDSGTCISRSAPIVVSARALLVCSVQAHNAAAIKKSVCGSARRREAASVEASIRSLLVVGQSSYIPRTTLTLNRPAWPFGCLPGGDQRRSGSHSPRSLSRQPPVDRESKHVLLH